jgi:hypothetical protein
MGGRIYPIPVKPPSGITNWGQWPQDIEPVLKWWNAKSRPRPEGVERHALSFGGSSRNTFKCPDCEQFCRQGSTARLDEVPICDDCLIARARSALGKEKPR